jgi:hypothetical protein
MPHFDYTLKISKYAIDLKLNCQRLKSSLNNRLMSEYQMLLIE